MPTTSKGCTVEITDIQKDYQIRQDDGFADQIRDVFALQLYGDPHFDIEYDGERIYAREAIREVTAYDIVAQPADGPEFSAILEIVEWKKEVERR